MSGNDNAINGGPSVGMEDSKFLLESSLAHGQSISVPQDSRITGGLGEASIDKFNEVSPDRMEPSDNQESRMSAIQEDTKVVISQASKAYQGIISESNG